MLINEGFSFLFIIHYQVVFKFRCAFGQHRIINTWGDADVLGHLGA